MRIGAQLEPYKSHWWTVLYVVGVPFAVLVGLVLSPWAAVETWAEQCVVWSRKHAARRWLHRRKP